MRRSPLRDSHHPVTDMTQTNRRSRDRIAAGTFRAHGTDVLIRVPGKRSPAAPGALCGAHRTISTLTCRHEGGAAHVAEAPGQIPSGQIHGAGSRP